MREKDKENEEKKKEEDTKSVDENKKRQEQLDKALIYASSDIDSDEPDEGNEEGDDFDMSGSSGASKEHSSAVIAAYARLGKPLPYKKGKKGDDDDDFPGFRFKNEAEAHQFFLSLANDNHKFLSFRVDRNGLTGDYYMSTGDGNLIKGKMDPDRVAEMRQQFDKFMEADNAKAEAVALAGINDILNPKPKPTNARQWGDVNPKTSNNEQKPPNHRDSKPQQKAEENNQTMESTTPKSTAPTPFKRTPLG